MSTIEAIVLALVIALVLSVQWDNPTDSKALQDATEAAGSVPVFNKEERE